MAQRIIFYSMTNDPVRTMWEDYHRSIGKIPPKKPVTEYFCDSRKDADELAELVDRGIKKATASSLWTLEKTDAPVRKIGDVFLITNWSGEAVCIVRITKVTIKPYSEITEAKARREGEGDKSLAYWRRMHQGYFERDLARFGLEFDESMPVVFEDFEKVYP